MSRNSPSDKKHAEQLRRNRLAAAMFAAAESLGITDRQAVERMVDMAIQRLGRSKAFAAPALPGMEELVGERRGPSEEELRAALKAALAEALQGERMAPEPPPTQAAPQDYAAISKPPQERVPSSLFLAPNALTVLERRYLRRNENGEVIETPEELFHRVARNIASAELLFAALEDEKAQETAEAWEKHFYDIMTRLEFLPNSPTLMNAGSDIQQLSACFVLPVEDSLDSIFESVRNAALIHQSGGGTGFSFSRLRPENDIVRSTGGVASGPVSFMRVFDTATDVIKQGGKRRGANMGILEVTHPDVLKFIAAKEREDVINNFNISVAVNEDFMRAVEEDREYDLINPRNGKPAGKLMAREVFDKLVQGAWRNGDPGIVFIDRINRDNPTPLLGRIESTNPCGEQPLLPYESCNLGSINVALMITKEGERPAVDWEHLRSLVHTTVRFLDNVIEVNRFPLPQIEAMTKKTRKIGLGIMGFADMLIRLGIPYDSEEALQVAEELMGFIDREATVASAALAEERGVFPAFTGSIYDGPGMPRVRNATRSTIAPTGTLSIIAGCSSGIEPLFALSYTRHVLDNDELAEVHPIFEEVAKQHGFYSTELMQRVARNHGSVKGIEEVPTWARRVFVTAHDIAPEWHVRMQAAFQSHTDNAVSKTINLPHQATPEDVAHCYMLAYKEGCKGITVFRDQSRERQVLTTRSPEELAEAEEAMPPAVVHLPMLEPRVRPERTTGATDRVNTGCGYLYVTVNRDEEGICEVFSTLGKAGGCASAQLEAICRLISLCMRSGVSLESVARQLRGIRCPAPAWDNGHAVLSCGDAIGGVMATYLNGHEELEHSYNPQLSEPAQNVAGQCPECSSLLVYQEGCLLCRACGYTKCG